MARTPEPAKPTTPPAPPPPAAGPQVVSAGTPPRPDQPDNARTADQTESDAVRAARLASADPGPHGAVAAGSPPAPPEPVRPPAAVQDRHKGHAAAVAKALLRELPEGSEAEPHPGGDRPILKVYTPAPARGASTILVGVDGLDVETDAATALRLARESWGL